MLARELSACFYHIWSRFFSVNAPVSLTMGSLFSTATSSYYPLQCHAAAVVGKEAFVFGGFRQHSSNNPSLIKFGSMSESTFVNLETKQKSNLPNVCGISPPSVHTAAFAAVGDHIYLFGGLALMFQDKGSRLNKLYGFHCPLREWSEKIPRGETPTERSESAMCAVDGRLFLFGGYSGSGKWRDDLITLQVEPELGEWTRPDCAGHRPSRRSGHTLTALPGNRIALFGGLNQAGSLNDLHVLSICDMIWEQVNLTECLPPKVYRHTANVLHAGPDFTFLLILGGKQGQNFRDGKVVPCCFIVDICTGISAKVSGFAFSRAGHTTSCLKSDDGSTTIYVHGGGTGISDPHLFFKSQALLVTGERICKRKRRYERAFKKWRL
ncbi:rab9 effector protein with kelch motifs-like isoform X2 [Oscarella lobularis]|uniref:rab9 effector protein with kelch motifs-like isoform X2 n=1 Tax=Oscarella lobularis TaxID=121494 RepID=UPI0033143B93